MSRNLPKNKILKHLHALSRKKDFLILQAAEKFNNIFLLRLLVVASREARPPGETNETIRDCFAPLATTKRLCSI